jgi:hypothetical protein
VVTDCSNANIEQGPQWSLTALTLLSICEFPENRSREGRVFVVGVDEITCTRVP